MVLGVILLTLSTNDRASIFFGSGFLWHLTGLGVAVLGVVHVADTVQCIYHQEFPHAESAH